MKIKKIDVVGTRFTYQIDLSNIELYIEAYGFDDNDLGVNGYEIIIYNGEQELCSLESKKNINNGKELWDFIKGNHTLVKAIWKNL